MKYSPFTYLEPEADFSPYTGNCDAGYLPDQLIEGLGSSSDKRVRCMPKEPLCKETDTKVCETIGYSVDLCDQFDKNCKKVWRTKLV